MKRSLFPFLRLRPWLPLIVGTLLVPGLPAHGQLSLTTAIDLALKNSPKSKLAQADVARAQAALAESKDAFIPSIAAAGGVGKSTGAPLNPPVIFSIAAQSLVFNSSQIDYIRAAREGVVSAQAVLDAVRNEVVEDVVSTYLALDNAHRRQVVETAALDHAHQLVTVADSRFAAGVDPHIEVTKARHTEAQIRLQTLLLDDEIAQQADHLARLTGLTARGLTTDRASVPTLPLPTPSPAADAADEQAPQKGNLSAAFAAARAKAFTAHGEKHYLLRPQVAFNASYSRISTAFTTYTQYYPGFGAAGNSFNSLNLGVEITVPLLDMVHRAKAHEAAADAAHSLFDAQSQQSLFLEGRIKLRHSTVELAARRDLAQLDQELAQDHLDVVLVRLQADAAAPSGEQLTPKDEQNARLQERLRAIDALSAELQLQQAEVSLMRQEGTLSTWLTGVISPAASASPAGTAPVPPQNGTAPVPPLPATVGTEPAAAPAPTGTTPVTPTTGSPQQTSPGGPVTTPGATTPPASSPATPSTPVTPHP